MEVPKKLKYRASIWPSNPIPRSEENHNLKRCMHPVFTVALFTVAKSWKQRKCPSTEEWIKKMWYIYTIEHYSAIKKEWNSAIWSNMGGPRDCHTEWSKLEKEKYHMTSLTCGV